MCIRDSSSYLAVRYSRALFRILFLFSRFISALIISSGSKLSSPVLEFSSCLSLGIIAFSSFSRLSVCALSWSHLYSLSYMHLNKENMIRFFENMARVSINAKRDRIITCKRINPKNIYCIIGSSILNCENFQKIFSKK